MTNPKPFKIRLKPDAEPIEVPVGNHWNERWLNDWLCFDIHKDKSMTCHIYPTPLCRVGIRSREFHTDPQAAYNDARAQLDEKLAPLRLMGILP
ncbi:MAG: hypothetical protein EBQ92_00880 [Proteobacteria bacterium]|nr:hypothetical protein [Pseudomonadota bacterium]